MIHRDTIACYIKTYAAHRNVEWVKIVHETECTFTLAIRVVGRCESDAQIEATELAILDAHPSATTARLWRADKDGETYRVTIEVPEQLPLF